MHPLSKDHTPIISEYWKHSVVHKNGATLNYIWDDASCCFFLFSNTWRNVNAGLINSYFIFSKTAVFTVVQYTNMFSFFFFFFPTHHAWNARFTWLYLNSCSCSIILKAHHWPQNHHLGWHGVFNNQKHGEKLPVVWPTLNKRRKCFSCISAVHSILPNKTAWLYIGIQ